MTDIVGATFPTTVLSRDGHTEGKPTGGTRSCTLEGCRGNRIGVRWPDGKLTWPCSKGMSNNGSTWKID